MHFIVTSLLLLLSCKTSADIQTPTSGLKNQQAISHLTGAVYHRFYLIKRLSCPIEVLKRDCCIGAQSTLHHINESLLINAHIKQCLTAIKRTNDISPFLELWRDFSRYKYIQDNAFEREFITMTILLYKSMSPQSNSHKIVENIACNQDEFHTDAIARYFYLIERLNEPIATLKSLNKSFAYSTIGSSNFDFSNVMESFTNNHIKEYIRNIHGKKNLTPVMQAWEDLQQYKYINEDCYLKELTLFIMLLYKKVTARNNNAQEQIEILLHQYEKLDKIPMEEMLEVIDQATDDITSISAPHNDTHMTRKILLLATCISLSLIGITAYYTKPSQYFLLP